MCEKWSDQIGDDRGMTSGVPHNHRAGERSVRLRSESAALLDWLLREPIRYPDGRLAAWLNDQRPIFPYEESTGYLISLLAWLHRQTGEPRFRREAWRSATALARALGDRPGCGRDGRIYLFDTAVCLRALGSVLALPPETGDDAERAALSVLATRLARTVLSLFRQRQAVLDDEAPAGAPRWSEAFTFHLLKALHHFLPWLPVLRESLDWRSLADEWIGAHYRDGLFVLAEPPDRVYLHAHCYAAEGLLGLADSGYRPAETLPPAIGDRLAELQMPSGALPRWYPENGEREAAGDATAQAVRLWQCLDAAAYAGPIARGLAYLRASIAPAGGIQYSSDLRHPNSWTTIFARQALQWGGGPGEKHQLI